MSITEERLRHLEEYLDDVKYLQQVQALVQVYIAIVIAKKVPIDYDVLYPLSVTRDRRMWPSHIAMIYNKIKEIK